MLQKNITKNKKPKLLQKKPKLLQKTEILSKKTKHITKIKTKISPKR